MSMVSSNYFSPPQTCKIREVVRLQKKSQIVTFFWQFAIDFKLSARWEVCACRKRDAGLYIWEKFICAKAHNKIVPHSWHLPVFPQYTSNIILVCTCNSWVCFYTWGEVFECCRTSYSFQGIYLWPDPSDALSSEVSKQWFIQNCLLLRGKVSWPIHYDTMAYCWLTHEWWSWRTAEQREE